VWEGYGWVMGGLWVGEHHDSGDEVRLQALRIVVEVPAVFVRPKHAERAPEVSHPAFRTMRHPMRLHQHAQHILHEQTCKLRHISALAFSFVLASHAFSRNFLVNSTVLASCASFVSEV